MTRQETEKAALAANAAAGLFPAGFHCAEAVALCVLEAMGMNGREAAACATAFGGGMGRTHAEACGALTGGLVAIGAFCGRREAGENWDQATNLAAELRERFASHNGTTTCQALRDKYGEAQETECRELVRVVAMDLVLMLEKAEAEAGVVTPSKH